MDRWISFAALLCLLACGVEALEVTIPQKLYEFARGDNITLPCRFKSKLAKPVDPVITWNIEGSEPNAKDTVILTYYGSRDILDIKQIYEGRVSLDMDLATGKADLKLTSITLADNKVFQCRLQIPMDDEGKPAATTRVVVLVAPSTPICKMDGKAQYGQDITLTCHSEEGSPQPEYTWESRDVQNATREKIPGSIVDKGVLQLFNISIETSGYFTCTSKNKIRSATCSITLSVMPPSMNMGAIGGIAAAVVGGLILLAIIICCCQRQKKKREAEEYAMGAREEFHDDDDENRRVDRKVDRDESSVRDPADGRDHYEDRRERDHSPRRDYNDRRSDYDDRRSDYDDRRSDYNDRRSDYDDRRSDYNDRRSDYNDDQRSDYTDRREKYNDRHERYEDDRRRDDDRHRDRRYEDDDRYDEPYDDRDKPPARSRRDYDD